MNVYGKDKWYKSKWLWGPLVVGSLMAIGRYSLEISYGIRYVFADEEERRDMKSEREAIKSVRLQFEREKLENKVNEISSPDDSQ